MKALLAITTLIFCSCTSTHAAYEGIREFPVDATALEVKIDYDTEASVGSARTTIILGFIRLGKSEYSYPAGASAALPIPLPFMGGGDSTENAAVFDALAKTKGDVLGFPIFRKKVANYFLWTVEDVWVKGYSGRVSR